MIRTDKYVTIQMRLNEVGCPEVTCKILQFQEYKLTKVSQSIGQIPGRFFASVSRLSTGSASSGLSDKIGLEVHDEFSCSSIPSIKNGKCTFCLIKIISICF